MTHRPHVRYGLGDRSHGMQVSRVAPDGPVPCFMHRRRVMERNITFVGLDDHKKSISVAVAEGGLRGEVSGTLGKHGLGGGAGSLERTRLPPNSLLNREKTGNFRRISPESPIYMV